CRQVLSVIRAGGRPSTRFRRTLCWHERDEESARCLPKRRCGAHDGARPPVQGGAQRARGRANGQKVRFGRSCPRHSSTKFGLAKFTCSDPAAPAVIAIAKACQTPCGRDKLVAPLLLKHPPLPSLCPLSFPASPGALLQQRCSFPLLCFRSMHSNEPQTQFLLRRNSNACISGQLDRPRCPGASPTSRFTKPIRPSITSELHTGASGRQPTTARHGRRCSRVKVCSPLA